MTDAQMLTIAIAIIVPLSMLIYSNSKITEAKETLRAEIGESKQTLRLEIQEMRAEMKTGFAGLTAALKIHALEHHK